MKNAACLVCNLVNVILIIGALNWGAVAVLHVDLVAKFLGPMTLASRAVYGVVGLAGLLKILSCFKMCPCQKQV